MKINYYIICLKIFPKRINNFNISDDFFNLLQTIQHMLMGINLKLILLLKYKTNLNILKTLMHNICWELLGKELQNVFFSFFYHLEMFMEI